MTIALTRLTGLEKGSARVRAGDRSTVFREQWARHIAALETTRSGMAALIAEIRDNGGQVAGAGVYTADDLRDTLSAASALIDDLVAFANTLPGVTATRG